MCPVSAIHASPIPVNLDGTASPDGNAELPDRLLEKNPTPHGMKLVRRAGANWLPGKEL
jgi:hypothetical protein